MKQTLLSIALAVTVATPAMAADAAAGKWFHMTVHEQDRGRSRVRVHLPLSAVAKAAPLVPVRGVRSGSIRIGGTRLQVSELRRVWVALPEGTETTLPEPHEQVKLKRQQGYLVMSIADPNEPAAVRIPAAVVDALLSSAGDDLNFAAAARAVATIAPSEVLAVATDHTTIRMWVDSTPGGQ